jgi:hypothetical protein
MQEHDCGCLPVVEDQESKRAVGMPGSNAPFSYSS